MVSILYQVPVFSALAIVSGRLEALYLLFHWTAFSLKWSQFTVRWYIVLTYLRPVIHLYNPEIGQWSICIPLRNIRKPEIFWCLQRVHERNIGLNSVKQIRDVLIQLQGEHLLRHLQKRTLISKKEQGLQFVTLPRNEFLKRCISRTFAKKSFKEHVQMSLSKGLK